MNYDIISIKGLEFDVCHGVLDFEKNEKQKFIIDLSICIDLSFAGKTDDLNDTVSYAEICDVVEKIIKSNPVNLIERLCSNVCCAVLDFDERITKVETVIHKPEAPIEHTFEDVSVRMLRTRSNL